jgi:hypothetical protein
MEIINFSDSIRVGSGSPACFNIERIGDHEEDGVFASFFDPQNWNELYRVELRCKKHYYGLFLFKYSGMDLPDWWKDSKLVWGFTPGEKPDA